MIGWHKVAETDELPEGRAKSVTAGLVTVCLTHFEGQYGALDNHCPTRADPWARDLSRIAGCAVPGTGTTTTPSLAYRRPPMTTPSSHTTSRSGTTASTLLSPRIRPTNALSLT